MIDHILVVGVHLKDDCGTCIMNIGAIVSNRICKLLYLLVKLSICLAIAIVVLNLLIYYAS